MIKHVHVENIGNKNFDLSSQTLYYFWSKYQSCLSLETPRYNVLIQLSVLQLLLQVYASSKATQTQQVTTVENGD